VALAMLLSAAIAAPGASAFIYWGDSQNNRIGRAGNDGTGVDPNFIDSVPGPFAVTVDASHIYWANLNGNAIGRANIDGSGVETNFITGIEKPSGVAVNASSIFWSSFSGPVGRADISGASKDPTFIEGPVDSCGVALDSGHVYWADPATGEPGFIGRGSLDGNFNELQFVKLPGMSFPCGVAVNPASIFWAEPGVFVPSGTTLGRANTVDGKGVDKSFIAGASGPCGVTLDDSSHLYWANTVTNTIGRANTDGTDVNQSFVQTGGNEICGVAVDDRAPPSRSGTTADSTAPRTKISKGPGKKLGKGIARFRFSSNEAGSTFKCKLDRRRKTACKSPKAYRRLKAGRHVFKVWAKDPAGNEDPTPAKRDFRVPGASRPRRSR
jgi:hypothetical protein